MPSNNVITCDYHRESHDLADRYVVAWSGSRRKYWRPEGLETVAVIVAEAMERLIRGMGSSLFVSVGDADGVDEAVLVAARTMGVCYRRHVALWQVYGWGAGHERNGRVLVGAKMLIAISPGPTPGTQNAVGQADRLGLIVHEWRRGEWLR